VSDINICAIIANSYLIIEGVIMSFKVNPLFIFVITFISNFSCVWAMEDYFVDDDNFNLETERFRLRLLRPEDAADMFEFTSNPDVV